MSEQRQNPKQPLSSLNSSGTSSASPSKPNEKHLEFLQNNINRMNQCSFQIKGWAIAIDSALVAIFASSVSNEATGNKLYLVVAIVATVLFWFLDSLYLANERKFIGIYNDVIGVGNGPNASIIAVKEFEIPLKKYDGCHYWIFTAAISLSEFVPYAALIGGLVVLHHAV